MAPITSRKSGLAPLLGDRALNRALLGRQMLLGRAKMSAAKAIERLGGFAVGFWRLTREAGVATLVVETVKGISRKDTAPVAAEGAALLDFLAADAQRKDVRFVSGVA